MNPEVIFKDKDILALLKPTGVVVHHDARHKNGTLVDWVLKHFPEVCKVGDPERPGIVHRLDKDTSGIIIVARTQKSFEYLKRLFRDQKIKKTYTALVVGRIADDKGTVSAPIARSKKHFEKRVVGGTQGKSRGAVTEYRVLERFGYDYTLLNIVPKTGRTHQIRSHMAHIGHPVACDGLYGGKKHMCPEGIRRHFLHASSIELESLSGALIKVEVDLSQDLEDTLRILRKKA